MFCIASLTRTLSDNQVAESALLHHWCSKRRGTGRRSSARPRAVGRSFCTSSPSLFQRPSELLPSVHTHSYKSPQLHLPSTLRISIAGRSTPHSSIMAPSRALQRCAASLLRTSTNRAPRLHAVAAYRTPQPSPLLAYSSLVSAAPVAAPCRRLYSQDTQASSAPEAPDYLSEGELHVFNKIKAELDPVHLEVHLSHFPPSAPTP
jgi:hypothetical protein